MKTSFLFIILVLCLSFMFIIGGEKLGLLLSLDSSNPRILIEDYSNLDGSWGKERPIQDFVQISIRHSSEADVVGNITCKTPMTINNYQN